MFPQISKIDLYVGGELLSPVDDKRLIGKCHFPERVVRLSLLCKLIELTTNSIVRLDWQLSHNFGFCLDNHRKNWSYELFNAVVSRLLI